MKSSVKFWISNLAFITAFIIGVLFFIQKNSSEDLLIRAEGNSSKVNGNYELTDSDSTDISKDVSEQANVPEKEVESVSKKYPIYITGEINNPGIYHVTENTYVYEVVEMAGGFTEEAAESYINLAAKVSLESHIYVPNINDSEIEILINLSSNSNSIGSENNTLNNNLVNINTASIEELKTLPGIGQAMAERIINYRKESGVFKSIEELMNISGIKETKFNSIKELFTTWS